MRACVLQYSILSRKGWQNICFVLERAHWKDVCDISQNGLSHHVWRSWGIWGRNWNRFEHRSLVSSVPWSEPDDRLLERYNLEDKYEAKLLNLLWQVPVGSHSWGGGVGETRGR